jgi:hypothetical protein
MSYIIFQYAKSAMWSLPTIDHVPIYVNLQQGTRP